MVDQVERVTETTAADTAGNANTSTVRQVSERRTSGSVVAARIVNYLVAVLLLLLAFRFVLALLGANPNNGFGNFIYSASHPFVSPFFSLFGYTVPDKFGHFELFTLVAMAVYAIIGFGIAKLFTLNRPNA